MIGNHEPKITEVGLMNGREGRAENGWQDSKKGHNGKSAMEYMKRSPIVSTLVRKEGIILNDVYLLAYELCDKAIRLT
jgi:hypothetical protein